MSINDYWLAKMRATEESVPEEAPFEGESPEPVEEIEVEEIEVTEEVEEGTAEAVAPEEESPVEEADPDALVMPIPVPTSSDTKAEIKTYLTHVHGIDPDDLNLTKDELLSLVADLAG
jgi:hypothetical protein